MILLLPGYAAALAGGINLNPDQYGWLLTAQRSMTQQGLYGLYYAIDNECFTQGDRFDDARYKRLLKRVYAIHGPSRCLFATAPDVVGNAVATWERSRKWLRDIRLMGLPCALVGQDGLESMQIQWSEFDTLFIGGTTEWKLSEDASWLIRKAQDKNKWTHIGRVNSVYRASRFMVLPNSVDGTAWAKHPTKYAKQWQNWLDVGKPYQKHLFTREQD